RSCAAESLPPGAGGGAVGRDAAEGGGGTAGDCAGGTTADGGAGALEGIARASGRWETGVSAPSHGTEGELGGAGRSGVFCGGDGGLSKSKVGFFSLSLEPAK